MRLHPAGVAPDALAGAVWECSVAPPGSIADAGALASGGGVWIPAVVPGTAAAALRSQDAWSPGDDDVATLDGSDWWYRCRFDLRDGDGDGRWELELGGLATLADVWLNGEHLLHSENMWRSHRVGAVQHSGPDPVPDPDVDPNAVSPEGDPESA